MWPFNGWKKKKKKQAKTRGILAKDKKGSLASWSPRTETLLDELASGDYRLIRRRCKQASINFPPLRKAVLEYQESLVGTGVKVFFMHVNSRTAERITAMWKEFTETRDFSSDGEQSFHSMQGLVVSELATVGEVFLKRNITGTDPNKIPYSYQIITPDRVADDRILEKNNDDYTVIAGIGMNEIGRKTGYYFYDEQDNVNNQLNFERRYHPTSVTRIPGDQIHHVYNRIDTSFKRGLPFLTTALIHGWLGKNLDEAQLKKQIIAGMFAGFQKDMSADLVDDENRDSGTVGEEIESGTITELGAGKDIIFPNTPTAENYTDFDKSVLRKISTATGISYESLSNDYSQTNYSSARHSAQKYARIMNRFRRDIIIEMMIMPILNDFLDYIRLMDLFSLRGLSYQFITPKPIIIDPAKEVNPKNQEIRSGLQSWSSAIGERGDDPKVVAMQIAEDYKMFDELGIKLDSDARFVDKQGQTKIEEEPIDRDDQ